MKILLIGGTGVLSKDVAEHCVAQKIELYMINRGSKNINIEGINIIIEDINNSPKILEKTKHLYFDVIVDFLSYNPSQLNRNLNNFQSKFKQYIFISSATIYSNKNPDEIITENMPIDNINWEYTRNKILCEELLINYSKINNMAYTIVRPYITYGDTRIPFAFNSKNKQWTLVDRIINNKPVIVWDEGKIFCTLTHTKDFARAICGLFMNEKAFNEDFHITSDENLTINEIVKIIASSVNKNVDIKYIPSIVIENNFSEMQNELTGDKAISRKFNNDKLKKAVPNFKCEISFKEGIRNTIENYKSNKNLLEIDNLWNAKVDKLIYSYYNKDENKIKKFLFYFHLNTIVKIHELKRFLSRIKFYLLRKIKGYL